MFRKKSAPVTKNVLSKQEELNHAFFIAITDRDLKTVKELYAQGPEINAQDENGDTPLHKAAHVDHYQIVEYLVETAKTDLTIKNYNGRTPDMMNTTTDIKGYLEKKRQQQIEREKPVGWIKTADDEIMHLMFRENTGYRLTEIFNFSSRTYAHISQNIETKAETKTLTVFDEFGNKLYLETALRELQSQGGTVDESTIDGKIHLLKDHLGSKP